MGTDDRPPAQRFHTAYPRAYEEGVLQYRIEQASFRRRGLPAGWNGSGTIFFGWCNLRCVFCQNFETSQFGEGAEVTPAELARIMLDLQAAGCHNVNFVTPEHVVPQILEALALAVERGLAPTAGL